MFETKDRAHSDGWNRTSTPSFHSDDAQQLAWPGYAFTARDLIAPGPPDPSALLPWIDDDLHIDHTAHGSSKPGGGSTEARRRPGPTAVEYAGAQAALQAAADIVQHERGGMIASASAHYQPALRQ